MYGGLFYFTQGRKTHPFHFKSFVDTIGLTCRIELLHVNFHQYIPYDSL